MNALNTLCRITMISLALTISGIVLANPCMPIGKACMNEGYYKGGDKEGKGLVKDCVEPIVNGQKTLPNMSFSDDVMQACKQTLTQALSEYNAP